MPRIEGVFFDVDFTLIHPGPRFQGSGYAESCARHGVSADPDRFDAAVSGAASVLATPGERYSDDLYLLYTRRIIELMGGAGPGVDLAAREIYDEWAHHHHFSLYDDVVETFDAIEARGVRIGLISNSHRCLASFQSHFSLDERIAVAISSPDHGYMKPHPSIFQAAVTLMGIAPAAALMVGDSVAHDVIGARNAGLSAVLLARDGRRPAVPDDVAVIASLRALPAMIDSRG